MTHQEGWRTCGLFGTLDGRRVGPLPLRALGGRLNRMTTEDVEESAKDPRRFWVWAGGQPVSTERALTAGEAIALFRDLLASAPDAPVEIREAEILPT